MADRTISYLGIEGSYSHQASQNVFPDCEYRGFRQWSSVLGEVVNGDADYAVVPVDNALTGRIDGVYRELSNTELSIVGEYILPISHALLGTPAAHGGEQHFGHIQQVFSHPQGFLQCRKFLETALPQASLIDATDTANAAHFVASQGRQEIAAISSSACASIYNLTILADEISDETGNATRFIVLSNDSSNEEPVSLPAITTLIFRLKHEPGSLAKALAAFSSHEINLLKLETYMAGKDRRNATFYVDVGEFLHSSRMQSAMDAFGKVVEFWKVLGTYSASPQRGVVSGFLPV